MSIIGAFAYPLLKAYGFTLLGSSAVLGTGYILVNVWKQEDEFINTLCTISEEKLTKQSLVSRNLAGEGREVFQFKIPAGLSTKDVEEWIPALEDKLDGEVNVWAEDKKFIFDISTNPLPKKVTYNSASITRILKDFEFGIYLGESRQGSLVFDFTRSSTPHLMFGGSTGGGKSNLVNQAICGILERYTPKEVHLNLIDLKDGVELGSYKGVEHVQAVFEEVAEVKEGLKDIKKTMKKRNKLFKQAGVRNLSEYNQVSLDPLPRILIVADEFAQFNNISSKELRNEVYDLWAEILQKGRSTGIHVMVGTQVTDAETFPKQIKGNIDAKFGFKVPQQQHSKMLFDSTELKYLPDIPGRGMFKLGGKIITVQVPFISSQQISSIISNYKAENTREVFKKLKQEIQQEELETTRIEDLFLEEDEIKRVLSHEGDKT